jgi:hypothetical protein
MADAIDPALARKLDAFTVPALPADFADRLVSAALAAPAGSDIPSGPPLPGLRRRPPRRWLRGGLTGLSAIAVGMISISAAAMGLLGEPIRHAVSSAPVIGTVVARVIPKARLPKKSVQAHVAPPAQSKPEMQALAQPAEEAQPAEWPKQRLSPLERHARLREIMADPAKRSAWVEAHPIAAKRMLRRAELRRQRIEADGMAPSRLEPEMGPRVPLRALSPAERRARLERFRELRRQRLDMRMQRQESVEPAPLPPEVQQPEPVRN